MQSIFMELDQLLPFTEIDRCLHQFVFECMDLAEVDPTGYLFPVARSRHAQLDIPWDDPYPYFKGMIPKEPQESDQDTNFGLNGPQTEGTDDRCGEVN